MTNDMRQNNINDSSIQFGTRLRLAREALRFEIRDVAMQLRLNDQVISMLESDHYDPKLPLTFLRGYLRSYAKYLEIPEHEVQLALAPLKQKPDYQEFMLPTQEPEPLTSGNYFMQFFTLVVVVTMVGLVGTWWYTHSNSPSPTVAENQPINLPENNPAPEITATNDVPEGKTLALQTEIPKALTPSTAPIVNDTPHVSDTTEQVQEKALAPKPTGKKTQPIPPDDQIDTSENNRHPQQQLSANQHTSKPKYLSNDESEIDPDTNNQNN